MAGGILQIVSSGLADVFLTSNPQITFFKIVFLKHTNFSIDTIEEFFDGDANFGENIVCTLSKTGDLIHRMYLKIDLPEVLIPILSTSELHPNNKINLLNILKEQLNNFTDTFNKFKLYIKNTFILWRNLYKELKSPAGNYDTINSIIARFKKSDNWIEYIKYNSIFTNVQDKLTSKIINFDLVSVYENTIKEPYKTSMYSANKNAEFKQVLNKYILLFREQSSLYNKQLFDEIKNIQKNIEIEDIHNYRFSWIPRIGLGIIDYINISIGGQVIDRLNADILNIWYELTLNNNLKDTFNKMIGDVPELIEYNANKKTNYSLYIPLPFWFSKYAETALPALSLKYHDIQINLRLKELNKCCNFEYTTDNINLQDIIRLANVSLYVDYIFIEQDDRIKYGTRDIEYLIEQHQIINVVDINTQKFNQNISFTNPVKEIFWVLQEMNPLQDWHKYGFNKTYQILTIQSENNLARLVIQNFGITQILQNDEIIITHTHKYNGKYKVLNVNDNGILINYKFKGNDSGIIEVINDENTISSASIVFNGIDRISPRDASYYNLVIPYRHHTNIPSMGIYNMTFSLHPEKWQPSGSCNMSILSSNDIFIDINPLLFKRIISKNDKLILKIFGRNMNILKISRGMATIEFGI